MINNYIYYQYTLLLWKMKFWNQYSCRFMYPNYQHSLNQKQFRTQMTQQSTEGVKLAACCQLLRNSSPTLTHTFPMVISKRSHI